MASPTKPDARRILRRGVQGKIAAVYDRGHRWVEDVFKPALRLLERGLGRRDRELVAAAWYVLGDVHDFNGAPEAAIRAYRRCLRIEPAASGAWRELGGMYSRIGEKRLAGRALRRALQLDPGDDDARVDLEAVGTETAVSGKSWRSAELLARGRCREALKVLGKPRSLLDLQAQARIHGALGLPDPVIRAWTRIAARRGAGITLAGADWYFLPQVLFDSPAWWRLLLHLEPIWTRGFWQLPDRFWDRVPERAGKQRLERVIELWIRTNLERTERGLPRLSSASRRL